MNYDVQTIRRTFSNTKSVLSTFLILKSVSPCYLLEIFCSLSPTSSLKREMKGGIDFFPILNRKDRLSTKSSFELKYCLFIFYTSLWNLGFKFFQASSIQKISTSDFWKYKTQDLLIFRLLLSPLPILILLGYCLFLYDNTIFPFSVRDPGEREIPDADFVAIRVNICTLVQ